MKKVLVISYYFPPANHIATQRAASFARYFPEMGIRPFFATRHWKGDEKGWDDYFKENDSPVEKTVGENYETIRLPFTVGKGYRISKNLGALPHRAYLLSMSAIGKVQPELDIEKDFYTYLRDYTAENRFDYILATFQPAGAIKMAYRLSREFGIPYIVDFRDIWNRAVFLSDRSKIKKGQLFLSYFQEFYLRRWLERASLISAVNKQIIERLQKILPGYENFTVATNGFEASLFEAEDVGLNEQFTFAVIGTLYAEQDLSLMIDGLKLFLKDKNPDDFRLDFIGVSGKKEVEDLLRKELPETGLTITPRIPHEEAIRKMKGAHVLFYAGWKGYKGITPGKIFDYLGARRNILIAPGDEILDEIIAETRAGRIAESKEEFASILEEWFAEWKRTGTIEYHGIEEKINFYTRENQTKILAREILKLEKNKI